MAKRLNDNSVMGLVGTSSTNYIKKISDGTTEHDLTVVNGITFFNGKSDNTGVTWDGVQELEVIIPTLADIVSNPVTLKGVIDDASDVPSSASNGDLYYIGAAGTYFTPAVACEAGDMAIYYDSAWHVISGENQITINAAAATVDGNDNLFTVSGTAKTLLTVEGKTLSVALDYADIRSKTTVTKSATQTLDVANGTVTVAPTYLGLTQADGTPKTIGSDVTFSLPTALANGDVTIADKVLLPTDVTDGFSAGSFPTISKNAAAINVDASTDISVTGTFLTSVSAIGGVTLVSGNQSQHNLAYATGLTAVSGKNFVSGVHTYTAEDEGKTADFEIPGSVTVSGLNTFVSGFGDAAATGDVVSSVDVGTVSVVSTGSDFVTGLLGKGSTVITSVTMGDVYEDNTKDWFVTGLSGGASPITAVSFGEVVVTPTTSSAMVSASVSEHVLSFTTGNFMTSATAALSGNGTTSGTFTKGGVKLSGFDSASDTLLFGGISQAATEVSYKSILTGTINVTLGSPTKYFLDKEEEHAYDVVMGYSNLSLTDATFSTGSPELTNRAVTVTIPADTVAVGLNAGTLPSLTVAEATGTISGTVGTSLTSDPYTIKAVASDAQTITIPGAVSLGVVASDAEGAVAVASASTYNLANGTVTVPSGFVTDVFVDGTVVSVSTGA